MRGRFSFRRPAPSGEAPRRLRLSSSIHLLSTVIAVSVGFIVLVDMLTDFGPFNIVGSLLVEYGLIIAAFALILGVLNVLNVHLAKVRQQQNGWPYSVVLLITTFVLLVLGLLSGPQSNVMRWTLSTVLLPLQSAFFSLLAFFLVSVAYRAMRVNSVESFLLVASAVIVIVGATPIGALFGSLLVEVKQYLLQIPATAGARGLLFGIALGTMITGLRLIVDGRRYFK